ncbi:hypothetical protein COY90_02935 [Candidatus Roizmanbacteria bacterium CG_4_10_14_0_8_um_filter_39_9]|uniref:ABC transporter domain-containing protein n=1 Tax=Candidatus Roizmanbacteria bacterium CG_4_10_14_0_8_um_filter_39_9 TaxID=1974829 RepID=A0A2M7QCR0_9BACT|nr:MAG: hypothetical protein COY90_02935 [Candidatus Roizmanbacteria bacterium CG_4_10_14_0_8_um_filter_39_9]
MISLVGVVKKFGSKTALKDISFQAKEGEIVGFLGPNGAGKTTTMRLLLGVLDPTSGSVTVDGMSPTDRRVDVVKTIGYLPENNPLYPEMKVREYLSFIAEIKQEDSLDTIIESVDLDNVMDSRIEEISRGYKQRVGLAAALCGDPKILILDEPTSGLDPIEQEKIRNLIYKIRKNKTVIFSTHILSEVEEIAGRIIIIYEGRIVFNGPTPKGKGAVEKLFKKTIAKNMI